VPTELTSPSNPRVKELVALRRRRSRDSHAVTLVEGHAELVLALDAGVRPRTLYWCPALVAADQLGTVDRVAALGAEVVRLSRPVFEKVAYRQSPDGWLAVVPAVPTGLGRLVLGDRPLLLVCEGVEKPGNLGAILRTADAAGVTAVIAAGPVTDWGNPNLVRASKGTVFSVPVASAGSPEVLDWLAERSVPVVAATPAAGTLMVDADLTGPVAVAVGSEKDGLSRPWLERAETRVRIPMRGRVDSLNVATSAAVLVYEAVRQRMGGEARP
jgi:RNA methyltransferase, TrmH family